MLTPPPTPLLTQTLCIPYPKPDPKPDPSPDLNPDSNPVTQTLTLPLPCTGRRTMQEMQFNSLEQTLAANPMLMGPGPGGNPMLAVSEYPSGRFPDLTLPFTPVWRGGLQGPGMMPRVGQQQWKQVNCWNMPMGARPESYGGQSYGQQMMSCPGAYQEVRKPRNSETRNPKSRNPTLRDPES